jgi:serine/threonine-protein kinase HipA
LVIQHPDSQPPLASADPSLATPVEDKTVAAHLRALPRSPLGINDEVRLSLPGAQSKLLLTRLEDGRWALPTSGVPSTHILKPPIADQRFPFSVDNEYFCMRLAAHAGLPVAEVDRAEFEGIPVLIIKRFDRQWQEGRLLRIHQEDSCQATGISVRYKYQANGGPSLRRLAGVVSEYGVRTDLLSLLRLVTFNVAIGNCDAHGKNFTLLHLAEGIRLAPGYDLMSTLVYPEHDRQMGMFIDEIQIVDRLRSERIVSEAMNWGVDKGQAEETIYAVLDRLSEALAATVDEIGKPYIDLTRTIRSQIQRLASTSKPGISKQSYLLGSPHDTPPHLNP